jgi:hypothetical protein
MLPLMSLRVRTIHQVGELQRSVQSEQQLVSGCSTEVCSLLHLAGGEAAFRSMRRELDEAVRYMVNGQPADSF